MQEQRAGGWGTERECGKNGILVGYKKSVVILIHFFLSFDPPLFRPYFLTSLIPFAVPLAARPFLMSHLPFRDVVKFAMDSLFPAVLTDWFDIWLIVLTVWESTHVRPLKRANYVLLNVYAHYK